MSSPSSLPYLDTKYRISDSHNISEMYISHKNQEFSILKTKKRKNKVNSLQYKGP
jgi:hypothetical protein